MASEAASEKPASSEPKEKAPEAPKPAPTSAPEPPKRETKAELPKGDRIFASPVAKKIALERGIPLSKVKGSGPEGRILREDVEKYQAAPAAASSAAQPPAALPEYTDIPISNMRRTIGSRLTQSKQELPHYYLTLDINMDKVLKLREVFNKTLGEKDKAAKLSVNDFVLKAVACALADVPEANSAWMGEVIRQYVFASSSLPLRLTSSWDRYSKVDISMAVATPTGLITPIIKDVGAKGLASISAEGKTLAKKARDGKLQPQEYQVSPGVSKSVP